MEGARWYFPYFVKWELKIVGVTNKLFVIAFAAMFSMAVSAVESKIAIFNPQAAIMNTQQAKRQLDALEANADYAASKAKFESLRVELGNLEKDAQSKGMTWSDDQKADFRKKMEYKGADLKLVVEKLKGDKTAVMRQVMQALVPKAQAALKDIVTAENIGLVLDSSAAHYATPEYDITAKVTDKINKAK